METEASRGNPAVPSFELPALHREILGTAARLGDARSAWAFACWTEQVLADTSAAAGHRDAAVGEHLRSVRQRCVRLAADVAAGRAPDATDLPALGRALAHATAVIEELWDAPTPVLEHAADWKTPESFAYDLSDPEVCYAQAAEWPPGPVLVVGVRTGGSYLAPQWVAGLDRPDAIYTTVRPLRTRGGIAFAVEELPPPPAPDATVVVVDDQPDTGRTLIETSALLRARYPDARIVLTSPGRQYEIRRGELVATVDALPLRSPRPRAWELLGRGDRPGLLARLTEAGLPEGLTAEPFSGPFDQRYPAVDRWRPWTERANTKPLRIDPRQAPLVLCEGSRPVLAARFIGEGPHGSWHAAQLDRFAGLVPMPRAFIDGYLITSFDHDLRPLSAVLPGPGGRAWLGEVARYWRIMAETGEVGRIPTGVTRELRAPLRHAFGRLRDRLGGGPLPVDERWIERHVPEAVPRGGACGALVRSSLPYAHQGWHWQTSGGALRRFGADSIWGATLCLDAEVAAFLVENHTERPVSERTCAVLAELLPPGVVPGALARLGEALLWNLKTWNRRRPVVSPVAAERITADLERLANAVTALS